MNNLDNLNNVINNKKKKYRVKTTTMVMVMLINGAVADST